MVFADLLFIRLSFEYIFSVRSDARNGDGPWTIRLQYNSSHMRWAYGESKCSVQTTL